MSINGISNLNQYATMMAKQKQQAQNVAAKTTTAPNSVPQTAKTDSFTLSENRMGIEKFKELINSDITLTEKTERIREAFGDVISEEALGISIQSVRDGEVSMDEMKAALGRRAYWNSVSPKEALKMAIANAPNNEDVERSKALSAKFIPIQQKLLAGKQLSPDEKSFIQEHYPELYTQAMQIEQEVMQLKARLQNINSKEEANQIYMETKMRVMGTAGKDNGLSLGMIPALDNAFRNM